MSFSCSKCPVKYKTKKGNFYKIKQEGRKDRFSKVCKKCTKEKRLLNEDKKGEEFLIEKRERNRINNQNHRKTQAYRNRVEDYKPRRRKKRSENYYFKKLGTVAKIMSDRLNNQPNYIIYKNE